MPRIEFASHLAKHVQRPSDTIDAASLQDVFQIVLAHNPGLRPHLLDDDGCIQKHLAVFINNQMLRDRAALDVPLTPDSDVFVMQAISGG